MTTEEQIYWYPVTRTGVESYLKTKTPKTQIYFELLIADPKVCIILRKLFIILEKKALPKTLEQYNSLAEMWGDYEVFSKKKVANMSWIRKCFSRYITIPIVVAYFKSFIDVDLGTMREKEQEEFVQAMFLASVYLHL